MGFLKSLFGIRSAEEVEQERLLEREEKANERLNLVERKGERFITLNGIRITTKEDAKGDLVERLMELRNIYKNS